MFEDSENQILLTNIQRFSIHDGPGIRTTVFLKGCLLHCPWCCNPENIRPYPQTYTENGVIGKYGKYINSDDLIRECLKDKPFYGRKVDNWSTDSNEIDKLPGGVTFSGGEALLQMSSLSPVCKALHDNNIHIAVETSLFVPIESLKLALNSIDLFFVDLKIISPHLCKSVENGNLELFLRNLDTLISWTNDGGRHKPLVFRIPVIGCHTDTKENCEAVQRLIQKSLFDGGKILKVELLKEHNLGARKYKSLGMTMEFHGVEDSFLNNYKKELEKLGIPIEICKV